MTFYEYLTTLQGDFVALSCSEGDNASVCTGNLSVFDDFVLLEDPEGEETMAIRIEHIAWCVRPSYERAELMRRVMHSKGVEGEITEKLREWFKNE